MFTSLRIAVLLSILVWVVVVNQWVGVSTKYSGEWEVSGLDGGKRRLSDWRDQVLVVHFWATWCRICVDEWPELNAVQSRIRESGGQIIGVVLDDDAGIVKHFLNRYPSEFPNFLGGDNAWLWSEQLGNRQRVLPFTVVIDRKGHSVFSQVGQMSRDELHAVVTPLLQ